MTAIPTQLDLTPAPFAASPQPPAPPTPSPTPPSPTEVRDLAIGLLEQGQADHVTVIDLAGKASFADLMIVASGRSARQVTAMAVHLAEALKQAGLPWVEIEGLPQADWVLIDAGDVIFHLFRPEVRSFYNLEKMWGMEPPPAEPDHAGFQVS